MDVKELQAMLQKYPDLGEILRDAYTKKELKRKQDKIRKEAKPFRVIGQRFVSRNFEPGWEGRIVIEIGDFATSPIVKIYQRNEKGDKTTYKRIWTSAVVKKNGKRGGAVRVIKEDHELFGKEFKNTGELADALSLPENAHGPYNALRAAGYNKNEFWAYVADLDQPNN